MEARYTSSGPRGVGTTAELVYPKQTLLLRVLEYEENRKLTLQFTSGPVKGTKTTFIFEMADGKTRVTRCPSCLHRMNPLGQKNNRPELISEPLQKLKRFIPNNLQG